LRPLLHRLESQATIARLEKVVCYFSFSRIDFIAYY
jgi:hypothetical protein